MQFTRSLVVTHSLIIQLSEELGAGSDVPPCIGCAAHHGVRDQQYKTIYWYNEGVDIEGSRGGGQDKEWELFDTKEDPLKLFNVYNEPKYQYGMVHSWVC
jgi:hypothetical protein